MVKFMTNSHLIILLLSVHSTCYLKAQNAFLIVDVQNCFVENGTLPIPNGLSVVQPINKILKSVKFDLVVRSQDWHCARHISFASQHKGAKQFGLVYLDYTQDGKLCGSSINSCNQLDIKYRLKQILWPDHCVANTSDAKFVPTVNYPDEIITVKKGYRCDVDSYSAFNDNGGFSNTELDDVLKIKSIKNLYIAGLAKDYCVSWTAKDAKDLGYQSFIVLDASVAVKNSTLKAEEKSWLQKGVKTIYADELIATFSSACFIQAQFLNYGFITIIIIMVINLSVRF